MTSSCQLSSRRETLQSSEHPGLFRVTGIVCGLTPVKQYTQSARFYCPLASCAGSSRYCYIRVHIPGKSEAVTVRNDFLCRYCGCKLLEDATCRTLAERCTVQVISASALHHKLWSGGQTDPQVTKYQAITVCVRDELVKRVEVGGLYSLVIMSSREIHENLGQCHCIPIFEANNVNKVYPKMRLNKIPTAISSTVMLLYEDRRTSPWSFAASLAYSFGAFAAPPGTYFHLKLGLLLSLMLLNGRDGQQKVEEGAVSLERLHVLAVGYDLPRLQRLLKFGASFAERMIVHSAASELFASTSRDPLGSGTCIINAGCVLLASGGICIVPNVTMMKKEAREKLQNTMENTAVTLELPEKYREHQEEKLSVPVKCTLWACADAQPRKATHFSAAPQTTLEIRTLTRAFMDRFPLVFGPPIESSQSDSCDDLFVDEVLSRALIKDHEEKPACYINDEEMLQFLNFASRRNVQFTKKAHELIQRYYLASRRVQSSDGQGKEFPLSSLTVLTNLTAAHAKLSLRNEVLEEDVVAAIRLYEDTLQRWPGFSGVCVFDRHGFSSNHSTFFGPENDLRMDQYHIAINQFCSMYANTKSFLGTFDDE